MNRLRKELDKFGTLGQKMNSEGLGKGIPSNIPNPTAVGTEGTSRECTAESSRAKVLSLPGFSHCQCWRHGMMLGAPSTVGLMFLLR